MLTPTHAPRSAERRWWTIVIATTLVIAAWAPLPEPVRAAAGLVVATLVPGWLLLAFLFPGGSLAIVERAFLAVALSLAVPALVTFSLFHWVRFDQATLKLTTTSVIALELAALSLLTWFGPRQRTSDRAEPAGRGSGDAATS